MKKIAIAMLGICASFSAFASTPASTPIAGVDYLVLETAKTGGNKVELREFFSYNCAHCLTQHNALQPILGKWGGKINHVRTAQTGSVNQGFSSKLYYALESVNGFEVVHQNLLEKSSNLGGKPISIREVSAILQSNKISLNRFNGAFGSPQSNKKIIENKAQLQKYGLDSEPVVLINGKYVVKAGQKNFSTVVDYLIKRETSAAAAK